MAKRTLLRRMPKAFTLIELSIVIVIILILMGLLLPAINSAIKRSKETQQFNELSQISLALESFKEKYGEYPPSRMRLKEASPYYLNSAHSSYQIDNLSVQMLRRMFPNIDLPIDTTSTGNTTSTTTKRFIWFMDTETNPDPYNAGNAHLTYELEGDECLVFFLAGIADEVSAPGSLVFHGFSKNPANPSGIPYTTDPLSLSRDPPLYVFDGARLFKRSGGDVDGAAANQDFGITTSPRPPKLPSYRSILSPSGNNKPIAYFSSYNGKGYQPHDCNIPDQFQTEKSLPFFQVLWPSISTSTTTAALKHAQDSLGPNPYLEVDPIYPPDGSGPTATVTTLSKAYKADGYQLITAGPDGLYGPGGILRGNRFTSSDPDYDNISNVGDGRSVGAFSSGLK